MNQNQISDDIRERVLLAKEIAEIEMRVKTEKEIPHLHAFKWYSWAWDFYTSKEKTYLLCAANQISKSSTQIRTCIEWATNKNLWPELWEHHTPNLFWYFYPSQKQVNAEFILKWIQFLPTGDMKKDPIRGWKEIIHKKDIIGIQFNSGILLQFKTYTQHPSTLQSTTVFALFCDEEMPMHHYDELMVRLIAVDGYFRMVFTATIGQDFWRRAMEPGPGEKEELKAAIKQTVSMYDCLNYMDGSKSHWTIERIKEIEASCKSPAEILKRIHGKFILLEGLKYPTFDIKRHFVEHHHIPKNWKIYSGTDMGSGDGEEEGIDESRHRHKSAICFVAVKPDYSTGRIFLGWRGDKIITTAGDTYNQFLKMYKGAKLEKSQNFYDPRARDFATIAQRSSGVNNISFSKAESKHEIGEQVLNTLFKYNMLYLYKTDENYKLALEFSSVKIETPKNKAKDDFIDAARYAVSKIPWDWSKIKDKFNDIAKLDEILTPTEIEDNARRDRFKEKEWDKEYQDIEDEFNEWETLLHG